MGADDGPHPEDGEGPKREVMLAAYRIRRNVVSAGDFSAFVEATGYVTTAERAGGSFVFQGQLAAPDAHPAPNAATPWWRWVIDASWRSPTGAGPSDCELPAVHISLHDASAYCEWTGEALPTEAQWEKAAQSDDDSAPHIWKGRFPDAPAAPPGPVKVGAGAPNRFGLKHACGNVWEWTADRFTRLHSPRRSENPRGPLNGETFVVKGGSFLCCPSYCARFRPSSRRAEPASGAAGNLGFRTVSGE